MMTEETILTLTACTYKDLAKHSKVININELEYYLWVYLNPEQVREAFFLQGQEVNPKGKPIITFCDTFVRPSTSWIRIKTDDLNKSVGLHIYKFSFVNPKTDDTFSLYMNYIIQREDVDKPYVYIQRDDKKEDER